jgi:hypothetical protein
VQAAENGTTVSRVPGTCLASCIKPPIGTMRPVRRQTPTLDRGPPSYLRREEMLYLIRNLPYLAAFISLGAIEYCHA